MRIYRHHLYEGGSQEDLKELNVPAQNHLFSIVGIQKPEEEVLPVKKKWYQGRPVLSWAMLLLILLGCLFCDLFLTKDPTYMDLMNYNLAPNGEFLFGTDTMGRDIFSMIWYGGRISLFIGLLSTVISTAIAVVFGGISGIAPQWLDTLLMRLTEILLKGRGDLFVGMHAVSVCGKRADLHIVALEGLQKFSKRLIVPQQHRRVAMCLSRKSAAADLRHSDPHGAELCQHIIQRTVCI